MPTPSLIISVLTACFAGSFLPAYLTEKAKNRAQKEDIEDLTRKVESIKSEFTAEVEHLRASLERTTHASKLQFDAEFAIYREIWGKLDILRQMFFALHPSVSTVVPPEEDRARMERRIAAYGSAFKEFRDSVHRSQPFYGQAVYDALQGVLEVCIDMALDSQDSLAANPWKIAAQNREKLLTSVDVTCNAIRGRFETLTMASPSN
jgi:hypothetical protein